MAPHGNRTTHLAWVCAAAFAVFVIWVATPTSANVGIAFFYVIPVGMAAWWGGIRWALVAVAGCTALFMVGAALDPIPDFALTLAIRVLAFLAAGFSVAALRERMTVLEHSAEELEAIRAALAPATLPDLAGIDAAAAFVPSELGVSGDFYLLTNAPDGSTVAVVGDVVGHGPAAARLATFIRARFAALASSTSDPAELLMLVNEALVERPRMRKELVSAACVRVRPEERRVGWALAGHPPLLRLPGLEELGAAGETFLLGARKGLELSTAEADLDPGSGVLAYTDGATDVRRDERLLGLTGLRGMLEPLAGLPARQLAGRVEESILAWADSPIRDDLCVVVVRSTA